MTKEEMKVLLDMFDERLEKKLMPIKQDIVLMKEDISQLKKDVAEIKEDVEIIKEDLQEVRGTTNSLSEWAEAATEYHFHDIHYPLHEDEKIS